MATEKPAWGYGKLEGELDATPGGYPAKLGCEIGRSTIRAVLKRKHVPPAPERAKRGSSWRAFAHGAPGHYQDEILTCDFFTTARPTAVWATGYPLGEAHQLSSKIQDGALPVRFLIHDRDSKFPAASDTIFTSSEAAGFGTWWHQQRQ